mmetsp:Transcript_9719/g.36471  ORF Transcript_9719/g.36471 Transcript_9719/m.36471 type:complete len:549 (-) Transcript_9719:102-1748(-)
MARHRRRLASLVRCRCLGSVGRVLLQLFDLEIDVGLPQHLRHVQQGLLDGKLVDGTRPLQLLEGSFKLGKSDPRVANVRKRLQILGVDRTAPIDLPQEQLELDIALVQLLLHRAQAQRLAEDLPSPGHVALADLELGRQQPQLCEGEVSVWNQAQGRCVNLSSPVNVSDLELLVQRVVDPQVDVAPPEALLPHGRHVLHCLLVGSPDLGRCAPLLLQADEIQPGVEVVRILLHLLLIVHLAALEHGVFHGLPRAILLLEGDKGIIQLRHVCAVALVERQLVDGARALVLAAALFEVRKGDVEALAFLLLGELLHAPLIELPRVHQLPLHLFPFGELEKGPERAADVHISLKHLPRSGNVPLPLLKLDKREPRIVLGLPLHPALKDLPGSGGVAKHFLHVGVLVPQLIHSRQERHRAIPHIAREVHEAVLHLHGGVAQPQPYILVVHIHRALVHASRSLELLVLRLPLGVLEPHAHHVSLAPDGVLELLALLDAHLLQLFRIGNGALRLRQLRLQLPIARLAQNLLRGDLDGRRSAVLHGGETHRGDKS